MTEKELQQQIDRAMQDATTLDYTKWSYARRQAKLSDDHSLWQIERDRTLARQRSDNNEARARYNTKLEAERAAKKADADAQIEAALAPEKRRLQNEWMVNHPDKTAEDFNKSAWIHLRENLIEQRKNEAMNAEIQLQSATGRYSL